LFTGGLLSSMPAYLQLPPFHSGWLGWIPADPYSAGVNSSKNISTPQSRPKMWSASFVGGRKHGPGRRGKETFWKNGKRVLAGLVMGSHYGNNPGTEEIFPQEGNFHHQLFPQREQVALKDLGDTFLLELLR